MENFKPPPSTRPFDHPYGRFIGPRPQKLAQSYPIRFNCETQPALFLFKCNLFQGRKPGTNYLWFLPHLPIPSLDISTLFRFFLSRWTARKREKRGRGKGRRSQLLHQRVSLSSKFTLFLNIHGPPQQFSNNIFRSLKDLSFLARCIYIDRDEILFPHKFLFLHIRSTIPFLFTYSSVLFSAAMLKNSQSETLYPSFFSISQHYSKHHLIYPYIYAMLCINVSNILSFLKIKLSWLRSFKLLLFSSQFHQLDDPSSKRNHRKLFVEQF